MQKSLQEDIIWWLLVSNTLGVDNPLFLCYNIDICYLNMDREKLKLIVKNLKSLTNALESEVYSDTDAYKIQLQQGGPHFGFNYNDGDDDGYPDWLAL